MRFLPLPFLLSFNGGYVDTTGFLALGGLFTAHVTGNFVTLGATVAMGTGGTLAKLLALPMFCVIVLLTRVGSTLLKNNGLAVLRPLLLTKLVLLFFVAVLAVSYGPFRDANSGASLATGMTMIAAMAIQNALHRVHLTKSPPSTLMTGTTTQIMLDLADLISRRPVEDVTAAKMRLKRMIFSVIAFASGCALAAGAFVLSPVWCFAVPVLVSALAFIAKVATPEGD